MCSSGALAMRHILRQQDAASLTIGYVFIDASLKNSAAGRLRTRYQIGFAGWLARGRLRHIGG